MGTWKLNEAKSKLSGSPKNHTVAYTAAGDSVKVTVEGVDAEGKPARNEWTGSSTARIPGHRRSVLRRAVLQEGRRPHAGVLRNERRQGDAGRVVVAADGKSRTVTTTGTDARRQDQRHRRLDTVDARDSSSGVASPLTSVWALQRNQLGARRSLRSAHLMARVPRHGLCHRGADPGDIATRLQVLLHWPEQLAGGAAR